MRQAFLHRGTPIPPPGEFKIASLQAYQAYFGLNIFVETGTYYAETTQAMARSTPRVYSIELAAGLAQRARVLFQNLPHVTIIEGDSGVELARLMPRIDRPALFWLDGHWCGPETGMSQASPVPIFEELDAIFAHPIDGHVIFIDDARYFFGLWGYPTVDQVRRHVEQRRPGWVFEVVMDAIRIHRPL